MARRCNVLPVPDRQHGNPGAGGTYNYWDDFSLNPPAGAVYATIDTCMTARKGTSDNGAMPIICLICK
jgi:hypothetical protein